MKGRKTSGPVNSQDSSKAAPSTAQIVPRLDHLKKATNWAAKKTRTMYSPIELIALAIPSITSRSVRIEPVTRP